MLFSVLLINTGVKAPTSKAEAPISAGGDNFALHVSYLSRF
jgi:hypothetical protein